MYHFFWYGFRYTFSIKALSWICFFHPYPPEQKNPPSKKIRLVNRHTNNFNNKKEGKFEKKMWPEVEEDKTQWHAAQKLTFCNISLYKNVYIVHWNRHIYRSVGLFLRFIAKSIQTAAPVEIRQCEHIEGWTQNVNMNKRQLNWHSIGGTDLIWIHVEII